MKEVVIVEGLRTPYAKVWTVFNDIPAYDLGALVTRELLERTNLSGREVDEVIWGNVGQPVEAINISRIIALKAGIPKEVPAFTVQRNCGSGMQAIVSGYYQIAHGDAEVVIAGGVESMSQFPLLFPKTFSDWYIRLGRAKTWQQKLQQLSRFKFSYLKPIVSLQLGLTDYICELNMGQTAELLSRKYGISREEQDRFALLSHQRAAAATETGRFKQEVVPVPVPPAFKTLVDEDNGIRKNQTYEALARLKPVFDRKFGVVTAGNSSQITDGAAGVLMMSADRARSLDLKPLGRIRSFAFAGVDPAYMGIGPTYASALALKKAGMTLKDIDLLEINEAFAAVVIANERLFADREFVAETFGQADLLGEIDRERLNVNGGAIALGHPVGSSAARLALTILKEMTIRDKATGLIAMCIGGGQGGAMVLERV